MITPSPARAKPARATHRVALPPSGCISMVAPFPLLVGDAFADRESPPAPRDTFPETVADGELRHIAPDRARRTDPERQADVAAQARGVAREPRASVVEERGHADADQPPHVVRHEHPVFDREPGHARARELVDPEDARPRAVVPEIEDGVGRRPAEPGALQVNDQRLTAQVLARDGERARHVPRVRYARREHPAARPAETREPPAPERRDLRSEEHTSE